MNNEFNHELATAESICVLVTATPWVNKKETPLL